MRWYRARKLRIFLAGLPDAAPDGAFLVVAYDWEATGTQSGRMPLDGISSMSELIAAAVDYGSEIVDANICEENCELHYMDNHGTERRVGGKTRFEDVKLARVLRVSRKPADGQASQAVPAGSPHLTHMARAAAARRHRATKRKGQDEARAACLAPEAERSEPSTELMETSTMPNIIQGESEAPTAV